ncbi:cellulase family glycosylhydrolase [Gilvimarinus xylanilyticus]|uniref:Glycoside hydrolase family 5 protein n=1 Tax=Gilvimarinus xylanilyticus TaxID=2944139 RepID=A0A9X2I604_9GAMM|nr:cellulase family glycosylhydrolase [Gilvimarinus xylanilyticus]MCP8900965.1 glycoside hydrolase family 5 protein [Gilvimarinus xylanilyticus]
MRKLNMIRTGFSTLVTLLFLALLAGCAASPEKHLGIDGPSDQRWSREKANQWYDQLPWLVGVNFLPSTAINQLEMWQESSFDPETIDRELGWAADFGVNTVRVYLHDLAWEADPKGFLERIDTFLSIADKHGIKPNFVFFDDCWNPTAEIGGQPAPKPGVHNSGWVQSPVASVKDQPENWGRLETYVTGVVSRFANDDRILYWDVYNEPGNTGREEKSLPLLQKAFAWVRAGNPSQPVTAGIWNWSEGFELLNAYQKMHSDIITFHQYNDLAAMERSIHEMQGMGRPVICTEWMARTNDSLVESHLPLLKQENVGAINWGLVSGKSNTIFPWGSEPGSPEPELWFHDLLHRDGSPYKQSEIDIFKTLTEDNPTY